MIKQRISDIKLSPMLRYLIYSIMVTILDTAIVWILYRILSVNLVTANTIGVITGFMVHYLLSSKSVFQIEFGIIGFIIYLGTFLLGLLLADSLIYFGEYYLFMGFNKDLSFLFSKGVSIVIPFFFLYYIRKLLFHRLNNERSHA